MQENNKDQEENEEIQPFHYEAEITKKEEVSLKGHRFVQRGPWLHCTSCQVGHGVYVGTDKIMVGYDDEGAPKLVSRR